MAGPMCLIWAFERGWLTPDRSGYAAAATAAGVFLLPEALAICQRGNGAAWDRAIVPLPVGCRWSDAPRPPIYRPEKAVNGSGVATPVAEPRRRGRPRGSKDSYQRPSRRRAPAGDQPHALPPL